MIRKPETTRDDDRTEALLPLLQALDFTAPTYRRYMAVREAGLAVTALATGEATVGECGITRDNDPSGVRTGAYTEVSWYTERAYLLLLHGGLLAQQRWLQDQALSTPGRQAATRRLAQQDLEAIKDSGAPRHEIRRAREEAENLRDRHWPAITTAAEVLDEESRITEKQIRAILDECETPAPGIAGQTLTTQQTDQARAIMSASRGRALRHSPGHHPPAQSQSQHDHGPATPHGHSHPPLH